MKRLLPALLPSESREHVLGDLHQRGNRTRDILSVLPRIWWSHYRRELFGPVPSLAGASEADFRHRCRRMGRATFAAITASQGLRCADAWLLRGSLGWSLLFGSLFLMLLGGAALQYFRQKPTLHPPDHWLNRYRTMLTARTGLQGFLGPFVLAGGVPLGWWTVPVIFAAALWGIRSTRRVRAELAYLDGKQEPLS